MIKKHSLYLLFVFFLPLISLGQNISVNTTGAANSTSSTFEVLGTGTATNGSGLYVSQAAAVTNAIYGFRLYNTSTSATNSINKYGLDIQSTGSWTGTSANNYGLQVNATGGTNNYAIVVPSGGGNVGIGTIAPSSLSKLEVVGDAAISGVRPVNNTSYAVVGAYAHDWSTSFMGSALTQYSSAVATSGSIITGLADAGLGTLVFNNLATYGTITTNNSIPILFGTNKVERMRIAAAGQVGINMTPSMQLDVSSASTTVLDAAIRGTASGNAQVYGIHGDFTGTATDGGGLWGTASSTTTRVFGVLGQISNSTVANAAGVRGQAVATSGSTYGVWGENGSIDGAGVFGNNSYGGGAAVAGSIMYGVYGSVSGNKGNGIAYGLYGSASATNGVTNIGGYFLATGGASNITLRMRGSTSGNLDISPAATTTSYGLIFPSAQGAANTFPMNDGAGNLSWSASTNTGTISGTASQVAFFTNATTVGSSANLYWDNTNNRLGIGTSATTTSKTAPLIVERDADVTSAVFAIVARTATTQTRHLGLGYDNTNNVGFIQARDEGVANKTLMLNYLGGQFGVGGTIPAAATYAQFSPYSSGSFTNGLVVSMPTNSATSSAFVASHVSATSTADKYGFKATVGGEGAASTKYCFYGQATGSAGSTANYGGNFQAVGAATTQYGVYGYASGAATTNYALYGQIGTAATNNYALGLEDGHIKSKQATLITAASAVTTYVLGSQTASNATDIAGNLSIVTTNAAGSVTYNFIKAYAVAPIIIVTPTNANAATANALQYYVTSSTTGFTITYTNAAPAANTKTYSYFVIETQ